MSKEKKFQPISKSARRKASKSAPRTKQNDLRARAEKALKSKKTLLEHLSDVDVRKLAHELQVHQIELEMQNEELRAAQEELEDSRSRYSDLYDFAPVGYFTFDKNGLILEANLTAAHQLAMERQHLIRKPFSRFIHRDDQDTFYMHRQKVFEKKKRHACEIRLKRKDKTEFYAQLVSSAFKDSGDRDSLMRTTVMNITERMLSEKKIRLSENNFQRLIGCISDGIAVLDRQWKYILVNKALPSMLGKSMDEMLGNKIMEVFPGVEGSIFFKTFRKVMRTRKPDVVNDSYIFEDGRKGWFEVHVYSVPEGIFIIVSDITDRKLVEESLLQNERRLKKSQQIASLGSWVLDLVNNKLTWSDQVYRIFGLKPQEFGASYEAFLEAVHPEDRGRVDAAYSSSLKERRNTYEIEHRIVRKSTGEIRYVHEKCEHVRDEAGRIIRSEGMVHDITERKKAEEQVLNLSKFPSQNPNPVLRIDRGMTILFKNEAVSSLLKKEKISEKDISKILPGNLRQWIMESLNTGNSIYDLEVKAGDKIYSYSISPIVENQYVNLYAIDITDRKKAEIELQIYREHLEDLVEKRTKELKDAYRQLSQEVSEKLNYQAEALRSAQLASIGELAAGVAHEINNPINGIINLAHILVNKSSPESREHTIASMVMKESDRIANIVNNLLSFSRQSKQEKSLVPVYEIIMDTLALTESQIRKDGIKLMVNVPADLPLVFVQPQQIEQVFLNIISNARYALAKKFKSAHEDNVMSIDGESVLVDDNPFVRITLYDRGEGIPAENLNKITNPFFTTKAPKEGTGLGLSICHGIISDHGGTLKIESVFGEFTRVKIDLPVNNTD